MAGIFDSQGRPTKLKAGDRIGYRYRERCLVLERGLERLKWEKGDDKKPVHFIMKEQDLRELAAIVAQMSGLEIKTESEVKPYGFAFEFVSKPKPLR